MLTPASAPSGLGTKELRRIADTHDLEAKLSELLDGWRWEDEMTPADIRMLGTTALEARRGLIQDCTLEWIGVIASLEGKSDTEAEALKVILHELKMTLDASIVHEVYVDAETAYKIVAPLYGRLRGVRLIVSLLNNLKKVATDESAVAAQETSERVTSALEPRGRE